MSVNNYLLLLRSAFVTVDGIYKENGALATLELFCFFIFSNPILGRGALFRLLIEI